MRKIKRNQEGADNFSHHCTLSPEHVLHYKTTFSILIFENNLNKFQNYCWEKKKKKLTDNTVKESSTEVPVILVIKKGDHVGQKYVIGLLSTKKHTEACDAIFH